MLERIRTAVALITCAGLAGLHVVASAEAPKTITIPAGGLDAALQSLVEQTGIQLLYDLKQVEGLRTQGVKEAPSPQAAMSALLKGTSFTTKTDASGAILVIANPGTTVSTDRATARNDAPLRLAQAETQADSEHVATAVQAADARTPASGSSADSGEAKIEEVLVTVFGRGNADSTRTIPQTVTVLDRGMIDTTASFSLTEVVRFIPTASNQLSEYAFGPNYSVRGFATSSTWNGMSIRFINQPPDLANVERVELLMGPASVLYGSTEPGAVINIVTKQPRDAFHLEVGAEYGSYDTRHFTVDTGSPFSDRAGWRLNASYQDQGAPFDFWNLESLLIAPVFAIDLTPATQLTLEGSYRKTDYPLGSYDGRRPVIGTLAGNPLGEIPVSFNPASVPGLTYHTLKSTDYNARLSHHFTDDLSLNAALGYADIESERIGLFTAALDADNRTLARTYTVDPGSKRGDFSAHVDLRGSFETGTVGHNYTFGLDYRHYDQENYSANGAFSPIDVFDPVYGTGTLPDPLVFTRADIVLKTREAFIQDRLELGSRWNVLLGARFTDVDQTAVNTTPAVGGVPGLPRIIDTTAWATQFGAIYKISDSASIYASRNTSFVPRPGSAGGLFSYDPERGTQYELGTKVDLGSSGLTGNVAAFLIEKPNVLTVDGTNPSLQVPLGSVEARGVELSVQGNVLPNWMLYAAYGYLDTEVTRANEAGIQGMEFRNAPQNTLTVISRYEIPGGALKGLAFSGSIHYVAERFADPQNLLTLPDYTSLDLSATYDFNDSVQVGVFGKNLTDEDIWAGFITTEVMPSAGRTYLIRARYNL
jgi:iron complex outermembrane receptor protein